MTGKTHICWNLCKYKGDRPGRLAYPIFSIFQFISIYGFFFFFFAWLLISVKLYFPDRVSFLSIFQREIVDPSQGRSSNDTAHRSSGKFVIPNTHDVHSRLHPAGNLSFQLYWWVSIPSVILYQMLLLVQCDRTTRALVQQRTASICTENRRVAATWNKDNMCPLSLQGLLCMTERWLLR